MSELLGLEERAKKARRKAVLWARECLERENEIRIIDFETTGVENDAEAVQMAIVGSYHGEPVTILTALMQPRKAAIHPKAKATHGITELMLEGLPTFAAYLPAIEQALYGGYIISYNSEFDSRIYTQSARAADLNRIIEVHCAMKAYAAFNGQWDYKYNKWAWIKLGKACQDMGIEVKDTHDAAGDCKLTLALMGKMAGAEYD